MYQKMKANYSSAKRFFAALVKLHKGGGGKGKKALNTSLFRYQYRFNVVLFSAQSTRFIVFGLVNFILL